MEITLIKASVIEAEEFLDIQKKSFRALLEKYQDATTSPANEQLEATTQKFSNPKRDMYFICLGLSKVGQLIIENNNKFCTLIRIGILPEYQNRGYAQTAIDLVETLYPSAKVWKLDTIKQEQKLCYLYEKLGYVRTGKEENLKEGMDLVFFEKRI